MEHCDAHRTKKCAIYTEQVMVFVWLSAIMDTTTVPDLEGEQNRFINEITFVEVT